ncbi:hypothetical protein D9615_005764 [Tricholomella constricta]|uniref:Extracellular mutant protein 11 C-terminal domain-containing protein n=1 Tax=Tricholomella constricta TaxID=117010 RepID=A0A8H5M3E1_9AGAR|nr:hypothetical protein D9615_005764 [Tricholomella constricta]
MSARQPFIPTGTRPASRAAQLQDQPNPQKANPQFTIDVSNPLHGLSKSAAQSLPKNQLDLSSPLTKANAGSSSNGGENRPLNTSSLVKRKNPAQQSRIANPSQNTSRRSSIPGNAILRPGTADPRSKPHQEQSQVHNRNHSLNIAAPVPRPATRPTSLGISDSLVSGAFTSDNVQTVFRMPALPAVSLPQASSDAQLQNDAHTTNSALGFSFSNPYASSGPQKSQLPSPPTSVRTSSTRALATPDPNVSLPPFSLNVSIANQSGPQRVLLNPDGSRGMLLDQNATDADEARLTLNRSGSAILKRSRADMGTDLEQKSPGNYKRHRNQEDPYTQRTKSITSRSLSPGHHSESRHHSRTPDALVRGPDSYQHRQQPLTPPDNEDRTHDSYYQNDQQQHINTVDDGPRPSALDRLLGCDVESFIEEHADQYERAVGRWKQCTMMEWLAGADEQAARYSKILDFVKDHMTAKMKLFASFDAKVDGHNAVLEGREKTLEAVKGRLVQESANVLGNGL